MEQFIRFVILLICFLGVLDWWIVQQGHLLIRISYWGMNIMNVLISTLCFF